MLQHRNRCNTLYVMTDTFLSSKINQGRGLRTSFHAKSFTQSRSRRHTQATQDRVGRQETPCVSFHAAATFRVAEELGIRLLPHVYKAPLLGLSGPRTANWFGSSTASPPSNPISTPYKQLTCLALLPLSLLSASQPLPLHRPPASPGLIAWLPQEHHHTVLRFQCPVDREQIPMPLSSPLIQAQTRN